MGEKGKKSGSALIFTRKEIDQIVKLYTEDLYNLKQIRMLFDCSTSNITNYLVKEGIHIRSRTESQSLTKYSESSVKKYYSEYEGGISMDKICKKYKLSSGHLKKHF